MVGEEEQRHDVRPITANTTAVAAAVNGDNKAMSYRTNAKNAAECQIKKGQG